MTEGRVVYHCEVHTKVIEAYERETAALRAELAALRRDLVNAGVELRKSSDQSWIDAAKMEQQARDLAALREKLALACDSTIPALERENDEARALLARACDVMHRLVGDKEPRADIPTVDEFVDDTRAFLDPRRDDVCLCGEPLRQGQHHEDCPARDEARCDNCGNDWCKLRPCPIYLTNPLKPADGD